MVDGDRYETGEGYLSLITSIHTSAEGYYLMIRIIMRC